MDASQRAAFARDGYFIVKGVLDRGTLAELNEVYDNQHPQLTPLRHDTITGGPPADRNPGQRFWSKAYMDLVDNPVMLPILQEILGDPRWGHAHPLLPPELRPRIRLEYVNRSDFPRPLLPFFPLLPLPLPLPPLFVDRQPQAASHNRCTATTTSTTARHSATSQRAGGPTTAAHRTCTAVFGTGT